MSVMARKIGRDLTYNKIRTLLVILSTAVGVFALGLVLGLSNVMNTRLIEDHISRIPAHISFWGGLFNQEVMDLVKQENGVTDVVGGTQLYFRWKLSGESDWRNGNLIARPDYETQKMNRIDLIDGHWPEKRSMVVERQSAQYYSIITGAEVIVEFGRGERSLPISGLVREPSVTPPQYGGDATFYTTSETISWLTGFDDFNRLDLLLHNFSDERAEEVARSVEEQLERLDIPVGGYFVTDPEVHWMQENVDSLSLILAVLGVLSLGLSAFLIVNTMNAIIAQQVWQIGVMKVFGATFTQVARIYLMTVLIYGILACLVAVPMAAIASHRLAGILLAMVNVENGPFYIQSEVAGIQIAIGLIVPILAAFLPVISGARVTPHQAISNYGLGVGFGQGRLDRAIGRIRFLPRPLALSLRNIFRRKIRLVLTLLTLTFGGLMFMVVASASTSLNYTLDSLINELGLDIWIAFENPHNSSRLNGIAESVPGVLDAEIWDQREATINLDNGEGRKTYLLGLPTNSRIFKPRIVAGRSLLPDDGRTILLNNRIAVEENFSVGDKVTLTIDGRDSTWTVVGLIINLGNNQSDSFVPLKALSREVGTVNQGTIVMVTSGGGDLESEQDLISKLEDAYILAGNKPSMLFSANDVREQSRTVFNIITYLMYSMAFLAAIVGGIGLMGTMSLNVVERGREVGVMRAIGASSFAIVGIFISEGVILGFMSWMLALPLSIPISRAFSEIVGITLLRLPLDFLLSYDGILLWFILVLILSTLASIFPALRATRVSVHETLSYE